MTLLNLIKAHLETSLGGRVEWKLELMVFSGAYKLRMMPL